MTEAQWINVQRKTFTRWMNSHSEKRGIIISDITKDFNDGVKLIQFFECLSGESLPRYNHNARMDIQKIQNINISLNFIKEKNVKLVGIGAEDILKGDLKLILGMIWTLILRFQVSGITEGELTAKEALLMWVKRKTKDYRDVKIESFGTSFRDGMALCALIHAHRPYLINYDSLHKENAEANLNLAFDVAAKHLGVSKLLDAEDIVNSVRSDEKAMISYISLLYHVFAGDRKNEQAGRRVGNLVEFMQSIQMMQEEYELLSSGLLDWMQNKKVVFMDRNFDGTVEDIENKIDEMTSYKIGEKIEKGKEKEELEALLNTINMKLRSNDRSAYVPPEELSVANVNNSWNDLAHEELERDEWLKDQLARQTQLGNLKKKFGNLADAMEDWIHEKEEYLATVDPILSLEDAEMQLRRLDAFADELSASEEKMQRIAKLADDVMELDDFQKVNVKARVDNLMSSWQGLDGKKNTKREDLLEKLDLERRKEALRLKFADLAKDYERWAKEVVSELDGRDFGTTLSAVEAFQEKLDKSDTDINEASNAKRAQLKHVWQELQDLGVSDNRHTILTDQDIENLSNLVGEKQKDRRDDYEVELQRQREMEDKRKEFARLAEEFVNTHLPTRLARLTSELGSVESDPESLIDMINEEYAEGSPEQIKLKVLNDVANEMSGMGIVENRHTKHTMPSLQKEAAKFADALRDYLEDINDEKELKAEFDLLARTLNQWIEATQPTLRKEFDNTLDGVRALIKEWNVFKSRDSANHEIDLSNIQRLYEKISSLLIKNNRPPFIPPVDCTHLNSIFSDFLVAEKEAEDLIFAELARQEEIDTLLKGFNAQCKELENLLSSVETYLSTQERAESLNDARLNSSMFVVNNKKIDGNHHRLEQLLKLRETITQKDYHTPQYVILRSDEISQRWAALEDLKAKKGQHLKATLEEEKSKEQFFLKYSDITRDFTQWVREAIQNIEDYYFGNNLEAMISYEREMGFRTQLDLSKCEEFLQEIKGVQDVLESHGVSVSEPNKYTDFNPATMQNFVDQLNSALENRQMAYEGALSQERDNDARRVDWAEKAKEFVEFLENNKQQLGAIKSLEELQKLHINAKGKQLLSELKGDLHRLNHDGIFGNKHTPYTLSECENRNKKWEEYVQDRIESFEEDMDLEKREAALKVELERIERLGELQSEFDASRYLMEIWIEQVEDFHSDPINVHSVLEIEQLSHNYDQIASQFPSFETVHNRLLSISTETGTEITSLTAKFTKCRENSDKMYSTLGLEEERQKKIEGWKKQFAVQGEDFLKKLSESKHLASLATSPDLQENVNKLSSIVGSIESGKESLEQLRLINTSLDDEMVWDTGATFNFREIESEYNQTLESIKLQLKQAEKELLLKDNTGLTPEQLAEYRDIFGHFDKTRSNFLEKMGFFGALSAIGEEVDEATAGAIFSRVDSDKDGKISFKEFTQYIVELNADRDSEDQLVESFKLVAGDKDFVTENDLRTVIEGSKVDYLVKNMPVVGETDGHALYDYKAWVAQQYRS
eukprot:TRINITY_DN1459_c0_g1_i1.p1 TRINITY_DN1459_c0_g1~~TRINITY_DN1459_c0_g1_i1.p1  ORF type:complete len:1526 (-),score=377.95 TRINITY_DN1459_c0_g1_i1:290-4867(-)